MHSNLPQHLVVVNKKRKEYSASLPSEGHSPGHRNCKLCEKAKTEAMDMYTETFQKLIFREAADLWIEQRTSFLRPKTIYEYRLSIKNLNRFFGAMPLVYIHAGNVRSYQDERKQRGIGASSINHDTCVLQQVLKRGGLWKEIEPHFEPLPLPKWSKPKVMSEEEEDRFFRIAATNPDWAIAYWVASLTNNTTASGVEVRKLQLQHVHLDSKVPYIEIPPDNNKCPDAQRTRTIPLNERGLIQMERIVERAKSLGAFRAEHFIFPFRIKRNSYDVNRPASQQFIRTSFNAIRAVAGLNWITPHCLRHQCITKLLESGVPDETVRALAGHVSPEMMRHYSHTRMNAKMQALMAIDPRKPAGSVSDFHRKKYVRA